MLSGKKWRVFGIRGVPVYIDNSWLVIAGLFVWIEYASLAGRADINGSAEVWGLTALATVLFFGSVLVHEAAHAVVSRWFDIPVTGITLVFMGGMTEIRSGSKGPLAEFSVAASGPLTTLLAAFVFLGAARWSAGVTSEVLGWLAFISFLFAAFNALPGFPLDGGRMLMAVAWGVTKSRWVGMRVAGYMGMVIGGSILAWSVLSIMRSGLGNQIFFIYVGVMMLTAGRTMDGRVDALKRLSAGRVADVMRPPPRSIPSQTSLSEALDVLRHDESRLFPVTRDGTLVGVISMASARGAGSQDPTQPVSAAMLPLSTVAVFTPDETLDQVMEWISGKVGLVARDGRLVGSIGAQDVERWYEHPYIGPVDEDLGEPIARQAFPPPPPPRDLRG